MENKEIIVEPTDEQIVIENVNEEEQQKKSQTPTLDEVLDEELQKGYKKKIIAALTSLGAILAALMVLVSCVIPHGKKNNATQTTITTTTHTTNVDLDSLGQTLTLPSGTTLKTGNVSGNIDLSKVTLQKGTYFADKDNASKADQIGKTSINLQNDTLKTDSKGTVYNKTTGYTIIDPETGKTIATGNLNEDGLPDGFKNSEELDGIYEEKDNVETLTYADSDYYDKDGNLVLKKGDIVDKETLESAKKYLYTTKLTTTITTTTTTAKPTTTTTATTNQGVINGDGTYTIFGLTFESKADYEQWVLQGYEGYAEADGIMKPEVEIQKQTQKTLVK